MKERPYWGNKFGARGYCLDTVGLDAEMIQKYVKYQQVLSASRQARVSNAVAALQFDSVKKGTDKIPMDEIDSEISVR